MPVKQIGRVEVRQGLHENLPLLASGELGWSTDQCRLFIGNGTGAPKTGNTEVITEYSLAEKMSSTTASSLSFTLAENNTVTPISVGFNFASSTNAVITYTMTRGTIIRTGTIVVASNGTDIAYTETKAETTASNITFSAEIDLNGKIDLRYLTTTVSGTPPIILKISSISL